MIGCGVGGIALMALGGVLKGATFFLIFSPIFMMLISLIQLIWITHYCSPIQYLIFYGLFWILKRTHWKRNI
jgi:hypothetical protein